METVTIRNQHDLAQLSGLIMQHGLPCDVTLGEQRTGDQNRKMWPMLGDISKQCKLRIDGQMVSATPDDWKVVFLAALQGETRVARGINGGLVYLSMRSSKLSKKMFSELIELMYVYGSENDVVWSDPSLQAYAEYREAQ